MKAIDCLRASWPAPPGVQALTTLRHSAGYSLPPFDRFNLGNFHQKNGDDPITIARNRAELVKRLALPAKPCWLRQVHGTAVQRFDTSFSAENSTFEPEADAAVSSAPDVVLAVLTADCLPVAFVANDGSELGLAHAGWRGLASGVLEATIKAMHTPAAQLLVWLGPAAGPKAYEVGADVFAAFVQADSTARVAFTPSRPDHWYMDIYTLARQRLCAAGVLAKHLFGGRLCTISQPDQFYSHRRDQRTGRMATLVWKQRSADTQLPFWRSSGKK